MTVPVTAARQATFCTEPADTVSGESIRKGNIEIPIIDDPYDDLDGEGPVNQASSPETSSPIYGSKSALQRFTEECRKSRVKRPPTIDDSSELEILSDVGLVGDSDSEVVPIVTPLSLSARSKLRKEPRIKLPSPKLDNIEPTILEETTQDILVSTKDATENKDIKKRKWQIRSGTVVVDNKSSVGDKDKEKTVNVSSANRNSLKNGASVGNADSQVPRDEKRVLNTNGTNNLPPPTSFELESSFCESDWQPRKQGESISSQSQTQPRTTEGDVESVVENKSVISKKIDSQIRPTLKSPFHEKKSDPHPPSSQKKRPLSSGDETRPGKGKRSVPRRLSEHKNPVKSVSLQRNTDSATGIEGDPRPNSVDVPQSQTPVISHLYNHIVNASTTNLARAGTWNKENEQVSGIPKSRIRNRDFIKSEFKSDIESKEQPIFVKTPVNMATSDGYDYESETFEEILQERNAMVKAERTYQRRIKQLEEELKGMINQCQALSDENKELRKTIDGLKKNNEAAKTNQTDEDTVNLAARIAKLETEKENLVKTNEKLSLALKDNDGKKKQSDIVFVENTRLKNKNSELEKKVGVLEQEKEVLSARLKELGDEKTGKASVMEFKYRELEVSLTELKTENKDLSTKVSSLEKEKKFISNTLEEKRTELNEMMRAMQNETVIETDLKQSKQKLEAAQTEIDSMKKELDDMKRSLQESEANKDKLRGVIAQRDAEIKRAKSDQEHKDRVIYDLRHSVERAKDEIQRCHESAANNKEQEKEINALKSRIGSLKAEIESSIEENQRLKKDREEVSHELNRLRNENVAAADAITESKRYFRKWEYERDFRNKAEVELAKKQEEVESLDARVKDSGNKINVLYSRLRALEDDRNRYKGPNSQEVETNNKVLHDENKKLRQMLIERNIELVNKENENEAITSKMTVLERKQKDAEVRVRQLTGWVNSEDGNSSASTGGQKEPNKQHLPPRHPKTFYNKPSTRQQNQPSQTNGAQNKFQPVEPQIAFVSPRSRKKGVKRNAFHTMTPPPGWEKSQNNADTEPSNHTPCSLPVIDTKDSTSTDHGYFQMYKDKMRRMKERKF